jgi:hypothetical protein
MTRRNAMTNNGISMEFNTVLNRIIDWAVAASPLALADDKSIAQVVLPNRHNATVAIRKIHLPAIQNPRPIMIDAAHRLAYPLEQKLEGIASAAGIKEGDNTDGL